MGVMKLAVLSRRAETIRPSLDQNDLGGAAVCQCVSGVWRFGI